MAIRLADYAYKHAARIRVIWLITIFISTSVYFGMLYVTSNDVVLSLLLATPIFVLQTVTMLVVLPVALAPVDILSRAITYVSGQASVVVPPNLNGTRHAETGLKDMIDVIFRLATQSPLKPTVTSNDKQLRLSSSLLHDLPIGVVALDAHRKIIYANKAAPTLSTENGDESIQLMFEKDDTLESWLDLAASRSISETKHWQHIQDMLPGEKDRKVYDIFAQYKANDVSGIEVILVALNKTEHYTQSEDDMDFISLAAHELRGPITVIHGYLDVLEDELRPNLQPDQIALFERLKVSASRLTGYINNILNVARYDRRHLNLSLQEDRLCDVYAMIEPDLTLRASTQNRMLQVTIPSDLPTIAADRNSLSEVLANLIDNGIKYSHEGGLIQVTAAVDGGYIKCSVQDSGMGMPPPVVSGLFTKFYRSHRTSQNYSGTGLGLYISKAIVESHGGSIGVRSKEGEGSVFTFSVPIYSTVADKLLVSNSSNKGIINSGGGWIKNHSMYKG